MNQMPRLAPFPSSLKMAFNLSNFYLQLEGSCPILNGYIALKLASSRLGLLSCTFALINTASNIPLNTSLWG